VNIGHTVSAGLHLLIHDVILGYTAQLENLEGIEIS